MENSYNEMFVFLIGLFIAFTGVPITQFLKNQFKLQDKMAVALTALVAFLLAVVQLLLTGAYKDIDWSNLPTLFFATFGVASMYYQLMKNNKSVLGQGFLLRQKK